MPTDMPKKRSKSGLGMLYDDIESENILYRAGSSNISSLRLSLIEPRADQPRKTFEREPLEALAESIATYGVLQPIAVRENPTQKGSYEILAGERRWRAAKMAGLTEIPVIVLDGDELKSAQISIIENIQREDLNPVEEALAYRALMEKFDLTQDEVSKQVGKSRSAVANMMRLLDLPSSVLDMLRDGSLTTGHARALLGLEREEDIPVLAERILQTEMTVRDVERAVRLMNAANTQDQLESAEETAQSKLRRVHMKELENRILSKLGRKAKISSSGKKKVIELSYTDDSDLEDLLRTLCGEDFFDEQ